ncbi:TrmH family RNA methyltransferase [Eubacterium sp. MSJ-33]|uniref:TrmH family RNA methyltransferase n=1 Tax=Eubacterium sp. MSJ-33 TaxID=2841528 RepID=UPI001C799978|nr:RNA methyltransferase [Eubacterium sp. MSJ-33]QWT53332.1 RNA methyltransferase [Eubacterium sp. MSJ-33]
MPHFISIQNLQDAGLDIYTRLSEVQLLRYLEPKPGIFIAESPIVVERALAVGYHPISVLMDEEELPEQQALLDRCGDIPVYTAKFDILTQITGFKLTRGMLCAMDRKNLPKAGALCGNMHRIAVLEDVMNPTNVGAIFRSAAALGMDAVLLTHGCADPLYRRAIRVSMGTVFQIPWTYLPKSSEDTAQVLHALGFPCVAMALRDDSCEICDPRFEKLNKLAVILGTEGEGLRQETIIHSDYTVKIPMTHGVDSLNVAAASAVAFWELAKRGTV